MASRFPIPKDARKVVRAAIDAGCVLEHGRGGHAKLRSPDGRRFVTLCSSASDTDYVHILKRQIRNMMKEAA